MVSCNPLPNLSSENKPSSFLLTERTLLLWGKTSGTDPLKTSFHPAVFHMIDVGNVASELLGNKASPRWGKILASALGLHADAICSLVPWLVSLHDIGKISADFQSQNDTLAGQLRGAGFLLGSSSGLKHPIIGQMAFRHELKEIIQSKSCRKMAIDMIGGHHGQFVSPGKANEEYIKLQVSESLEWAEYRKVTALFLKNLFLEVEDIQWPEPPNISAATMALTGFAILCDWMGSDETYFKSQAGMPIEEYLTISKKRAEIAVENSGLYLPSVSKTPSNFNQIFPKLKSIRPLQKAVDDIPSNILEKPSLVIIEAPTGEGKTEAALAIAHRLAKLGGASGSDDLYFALPTTATSNQMFIRLQQYLEENLELKTGINLVHGQAFLVKDDLTTNPLINGKDESTLDLMNWFSPKKKALLAPFGVGTVDQLELSAMNVRHNALRMIGLAGKTVIIDEVHAYDAYMSTIIQHALSWLSAMGTSVILLSATLPLGRRQELIQAYLGEQPTDTNPFLLYPSLTIINQDNKWEVSPPASQPNRQIQVQPLNVDGKNTGEKANWLLHEVEHGGCACWITNTVNQAQEIYTAVRTIAPDDIKCLLLHSRFPLDRRQEIEKELRVSYGPGENRPERSIVIGTQVLEQSLDLDFDIMVSDLAPIDLLLQRAGRLHRHQRKNRPAQHSMPRFFINAEKNSEGSIDISTDKFVYAEYLLRKTWQVIQNEHVFNLPGDYRRLIEAVYDETPVSEDDELFGDWMQFKRKLDGEIEKALLRLIPPPNANETFTMGFNNLIFDEDDESASWVAAQTRLGQESITVIPLEKDGNTAFFAGLNKPVNLDHPIDRSSQLALLRHSLRIDIRDLVQSFKSNRDSIPILFSRSSLLKGAYPLWLSNGKASFTTDKKVISLVLDQELGLVIQK
jgi:CRISPR-associated endonuclease/helicase Cas3